jgi:hypothetical protein
MTDSLASVDLRGESLIVYWYVQAGDRPWRMAGGFTVLEGSSGAAQLGAVVRDAIASSRAKTVPVSLESGEGFRSMLRALQVKSVLAYNVGVRSVGISAEGRVVRIEPTRNLGPRNGFEPISEHEVTLDTPEPSDLGNAVFAALADSG